MRKTESGLMLVENNLGVDLVDIYTRSCYLHYGLPNFADIYDEYRIDILQKNLDVNEEALKSQLSHLRTGKDLDELKTIDVNELVMLNEAEFFHHVINKNLSFKEGKLVLNSPVKDVW